MRERLACGGGLAKTKDGSAKIEKWWSDEVMKPED